MGNLGATCAHTISDETRRLTKEEWDKERFGQICGTSQAYSDMVKVVLKLCRITRRCTYEDIALIKSFGGKIHEISGDEFRLPSPMGQEAP